MLIYLIVYKWLLMLICHRWLAVSGVPGTYSRSSSRSFVSSRGQSRGGIAVQAMYWYCNTRSHRITVGLRAPLRHHRTPRWRDVSVSWLMVVLLCVRQRITASIPYTFVALQTGFGGLTKCRSLDLVLKKQRFISI